MAIGELLRVQNSVRPRDVMTLRQGDEDGPPRDISAGITAVNFHMRQKGSTALYATVPCTPLSGVLQDDGSINTAPPYNVAGAGGRIRIDWTPASVATAGKFEGEVELVYSGGETETVYQFVPITIRKQIG